jgi:hypothetical protein
MDQSQQKDKFKCNECGLTFNSERERREHQENAHHKGAGESGRQGGFGSGSQGDR